MRQSLQHIKEQIDRLGNDIDEKDIDLRNILQQIVQFIDLVTPVDQDPEL